MTEIQKFSRPGEDNPDNLPVSSNVKEMEFNIDDDYPLIVTFWVGNAKYAYRIQELDEPLEDIWDKLCNGVVWSWKYYSPGSVLEEWIKNKCTTMKILPNGHMVKVFPKQ